MALTTHSERQAALVQVVLLSDTEALRSELAQRGLDTETVSELAPIQVLAAKDLREFFTYLGRNEKLRLSGRPNTPMGVLSTSKLYRSAVRS